MKYRILTFPKTQSFFLFGPRGVGKTTLLHAAFPKEQCLWLDLLTAEFEAQFSDDPDELAALVRALPAEKTHVVIDEIQKIPKLLDVVHQLIEDTDKKFILTGSSARKLKRGGANLLAGRAFVYHLHPFTFTELDKEFELTAALQWGMLPKIRTLGNDSERMQFLQAYANTYLKEEIWEEQFVKNLSPFRRFLEVAAQNNGKVVNFANIARDVGVDDKTVERYFSILEDTLIGFFLPAFHHSFRKQLGVRPKFYFFDTGVVRALSRTLSIPLLAANFAYGDAFEHFIILECIKLAGYYCSEYRFSHIRTYDDTEIDLVVERPGLPLLLIEIKSKKNVDVSDLKTIETMAREIGHCEAICLSNDKNAKRYDNVTVYPWQEGIKKFFSC